MPFSYETERLQKRIPSELLLEKLLVHDPWNLLAVNSSNKHGTRGVAAPNQGWTDKKDITHVYKLQVSKGAKGRKAGEEKAVKKKMGEDMKVDEEHGEIQHGFVVFPPSDAPSAAPPGVSSSAPVFVTFAGQLRETEEAHLYLSAAHACGTGHHSEVWHAEWEITRGFVTGKDEHMHVLCGRCVLEDVVRSLDEAKAWKRRIGKLRRRKVDGWAIYDAVLDPSTKALRVRKIEVRDDGRREEVLQPNPREWNEIAIENSHHLRCMQTKVTWQSVSRPSCRHILPSSAPGPDTAKVRVVAKLSRRWDCQLAAEALNYQAFPDHFFEHWSGFNMLESLKGPVPVCPVVPQYYGYYVPDEGNETYLSPVLLLEDCGKPVDFSTLTKDQTWVFLFFPTLSPCFLVVKLICTGLF